MLEIIKLILEPIESHYHIYKISITSNTEILLLLVLSFYYRRNVLDFSTSIFAHLSLGKPNIPELITGIEILLKPLSDASKRLLLTAFLSL